MLLLWSAQSGLVLLAHAEASRDHATAPHDESKCRVCAAVHAPVVDTAQPLPQIAVLDPAGMTCPVDVQAHSNAWRLIPTCRGPPVA
jgi:hypothetical protein